MKKKKSYAQEKLFEVAKEILAQKQSIKIDSMDDEIDLENKDASRRALTFALNKVYEKIDELDRNNEK